MEDKKRLTQMGEYGRDITMKYNMGSSIGSWTKKIKKDSSGKTDVILIGSIDS